MSANTLLRVLFCVLGNHLKAGGSRVRLLPSSIAPARHPQHVLPSTGYQAQSMSNLGQARGSLASLASRGASGPRAGGVHRAALGNGDTAEANLMPHGPWRGAGIARADRKQTTFGGRQEDKRTNLAAGPKIDGETENDGDAVLVNGLNEGASIVEPRAHISLGVAPIIFAVASPRWQNVLLFWQLLLTSVRIALASVAAMAFGYVLLRPWWLGSAPAGSARNEAAVRGEFPQPKMARTVSIGAPSATMAAVLPAAGKRPMQSSGVTGACGPSALAAGFRSAHAQRATLQRVKASEQISPAESRAQLEATGDGNYQMLSSDQRSAVSGFFFPDPQELDMEKTMPLEDHIIELRDGVIRAAIAATVCVGTCLTYYKELATLLEMPAQSGGIPVKFVQLAPGEFFFVSVKAAFAVGLLLAFPYALFEAAVYFTPALTRSERGIVSPVVLSSSLLFYFGAAFAFAALSPAALGFFLSYSQDVIESQFSIDEYFEFILSMGFATGIAFQVPVLQVVLGLVGVLKSDQLFSVWRYVVVGAAVLGAILTPSTDPITQLLLSGALCALYFAGAGVLSLLGR